MRPWLYAASALALLAFVPSGEAGMGEFYDLEDLSFLGYGCRPTEEELSTARTPRADIMGAVNLHAGLFEDPYVVDVPRWNFTGPLNENKDPSALEGDPGGTGPLSGEPDRSRAASLGKAGYAMVRFDAAIPDGDGDDVEVYEAAQSPSGGFGVAEPYCVYGASSASGPFAYVGLALPASGQEVWAFDLGAHYTTFSGTSSLTHLLILDSGQAERILEPVIGVSPATTVDNGVEKEVRLKRAKALRDVGAIFVAQAKASGHTKTWQDELAKHMDNIH